MAAMKNLAFDYCLGADDPEVAFTTAVDMEIAVRHWAKFLGMES